MASLDDASAAALPCEGVARLFGIGTLLRARRCTAAFVIATGIALSVPTVPPSCSGAWPRCTVAMGSTTCSDTTNAVTVAQGDYVEVQVQNQGDTTGTEGFSVEVADVP
jgi:hypothetical protein